MDSQFSSIYYSLPFSYDRDVNTAWESFNLYSCTQLALNMFNDPMAILHLSSMTQEKLTGAGQSKPWKIEAAKLHN